MKLPQISGLANFGLIQRRKDFSRDYNFPAFQNSSLQGLPKDTLSFSSKAQYIKKYNTLPDEIKDILSPKDAIDMFANMEKMARGKERDGQIGAGYNSKVYINPWLEQYYVLILQEPSDANQIIYSQKDLGDSIWQDNKDSRIYLIKAG